MSRAENDVAFMRCALEEARKGTPSPNPHVGAVLVAPSPGAGDGEIVGRGHHPRPGREHAEVMAIREAGPRARGATLYVTLEPCNHHGRTPPCTDAIIAAGVARVVVGVRDPNPHVEGGGNDKLRAAGVEVVEHVEEAESARIVAPFAKHVRTGRPWVRLKLAASLDGRIASAQGVSKWITGAEARREVHALRATVDAVAVGIGTALADDPALTVRDVAPLADRAPPSRVVFDANARLPIESQLARTAGDVPTIALIADDAPAARVDALLAAQVRLLRVARGPGGVDLPAALDALGREGVVDLLVEGGATLGGGLVAADLVDEIRWYLAPLALGAGGTAALLGPAPESPEQASRYLLDRVERVGEDLALTLFRAKKRG
ncbi:MAG: bifunctional diaminohydroxyphosphoribosylaminopyrimidine deaminase/5-amino-6-(5-phosphoribosylamino)uracil reductase RibD [Deltaproteobacteria bacterium]|nr:bifunctional diaminohydroxyphosphoribosylaminopyrimidine deaminase/5-amino-6-(5-phosphoribosylamino)uracil reductase RibD [Deltaproteobacteria bacterium]